MARGRFHVVAGIVGHLLENTSDTCVGEFAVGISSVPGERYHALRIAWRVSAVTAHRAHAACS